MAGGDALQGLSDSEVRARLQEYGRNELAAEKPIPAWRRFLAQFQDVLVILLLVATAISAGLWFYERDTPVPYEALAILAVVVLNAAQRRDGLRAGVARGSGGRGAARDVRGRRDRDQER
jgi:Ca2+-transporting ATPase